MLGIFPVLFFFLSHSQVQTLCLFRDFHPDQDDFFFFPLFIFYSEDDHSKDEQEAEEEGNK